VISDYKHFVRHFSLDESLIKFASRPELRNRQTAFLTDMVIENIGFIGVAEDYDNSLLRLGDFLGREIKSIRSNQAPDDQKIELSDCELSLLRDLNSDDVALYKYVSERSTDRKTSAPSEIRGSARRHSDNSIRGWAVCGEPNRIVRLGLEIDGAVVNEDGILCDIYRADLVSSGESPTGLGGFEIDLSAYGTKEKSVFRIFSGDWSITI
jgi:hypothetical protein